MSTLRLDATAAEIRSEVEFLKVMRSTLPFTEEDYDIRMADFNLQLESLKLRLRFVESTRESAPTVHEASLSSFPPAPGLLASAPGFQTYESFSGTKAHDHLPRENLYTLDRQESEGTGNSSFLELDSTSDTSPFSHPSLGRSHSIRELQSRKRSYGHSNVYAAHESPLSKRATRNPNIAPQSAMPSSMLSTDMTADELETFRALTGLDDATIEEARKSQARREQRAEWRAQQEIRDAAIARSLFQEDDMNLASGPKAASAVAHRQPNSWGVSEWAKPFQASQTSQGATPNLPASLPLKQETVSWTSNGASRPTTQPAPLMAFAGLDNAASTSNEARVPGTYIDIDEDSPLSDEDFQILSPQEFRTSQRTLASSDNLGRQPPQNPWNSHWDKQNRSSMQASAAIPSGSMYISNAPYSSSSRHAVGPSLNGGIGIDLTGFSSGNSFGRNLQRAWNEGSEFLGQNVGLGSASAPITISSQSGPSYASSSLARPIPFDAGLRAIMSRNPYLDLVSGALPSGLESDSRTMAYYDYVTNDPTKTREELKSLLENIRPDMDLPPEDREGTPDAMKYPLMEHQKLGLTWMKSMEDGSNKGGILADDMGLGKTIQTLALLVSKKSRDPKCKTTLIVAPVALMKQWEREIHNKLMSHSRLTTFILHGYKRNTSWSTLRTFDVVLTTFGTLASEYNKREKAQASRDAGGAEPMAKLALLGPDSQWYRVIIDEAQCIKNRHTKAAQGACALNARTRFCLTGTPMMNGVGELHSLIEFLRIKPYNDSRRFLHAFGKPLKGNYEGEKQAAMRKLQALLKAILLRRTKQSKIDGKPIINLPTRTDEVVHAVFDEDQQAFYRALETQSRLQFNKYLRAGTVGKHYSNVLTLLLRLRQACCHPHLINDFAQEVVSTVVSSDRMMELARDLAPDVVERIKQMEAFECPVCYDAVENPAIFIPCGHDTCTECFTKISDQSNVQGLAQGSEQTETKCPSCRGKISAQTIIDYATFKKVHLPELVPAEARTIEADADDSETESEADEDEDEDEDEDSDSGSDLPSLSDVIAPDTRDEETESGSQASEADEASSDADGYGKGANPFVRSRKTQVVDKKLILGKKSASKGNDKSKGKGKGKGKGKSRAKESASTKGKSLAQLKKEGMRNAKSRRSYMRRLTREWVPSAKVDKCCDILQRIQDAGEGEKTIIFSQFTSLLDLLEIPIARKGWKFKRYDGSMTLKQRNDAVLDFTDLAECKIMLVSLKAGNAGLNLVAANQVIILDPFWNPFIEEQAIDRTHRIGQMRPVKVHKILVQETVEDRIIELQDKKRALIEGALDEKASQSIGRLGTRELAYLFGVDTQQGVRTA